MRKDPGGDLHAHRPGNPAMFGSPVQDENFGEGLLASGRSVSDVGLRNRFRTVSPVRRRLCAFPAWR